MQDRQQGQEYFGALLRAVVGNAFAAAGYHLDKAPLQQAGGRFRFVKAFDDGSVGWIDFQVLVYSDTMWSGGTPSRFRVQLTRSCANRRTAAPPDQLARGLSQLVVADFGVRILPSSDHWWTYSDTDSLGKALAEAGHLIVGYGIPWLAGELRPPDETRGDLA